MTVVARAGETLAGNGPLLASCPGLEDMEHGAVDGLLQLGVTLELDLGSLPEFVQIGALRVGQTLPAGVPSLGQRSFYLGPNGRLRALSRPPVGQKLDDSKALTRRQVGRDGHASEVLLGLRCDLRPGWTVDHMVHTGCHPQPAGLGDVTEDDPAIPAEKPLRAERRLQRSRGARVAIVHGRWLVGDQL